MICYNPLVPDVCYNSREQTPGPRHDPMSLASRTMDQAVGAIFAINPDDGKKIVASKPGKGKKK